MPGIGGTVKEKPKDSGLQKIMVGDVELTEVRGQKGHFTGYKEESARTVVVDMRMTNGGYNLKVYFLGGGEWARNLKGDELTKALGEWGFKGDELGKILHEGDLRGMTLDKTLGGFDRVSVAKGKEGGADLQVLKGGKIVQTLKGAMVKNYVDITEGWEGIPRGSAGTSEEFTKFWDSARMAMADYLKKMGKELPDRINMFMGQAHPLH